MAELRWQRGPNTCFDLKDEAGSLYGYVAPVTVGFRGYVIRPGEGSRRARLIELLDHATPEAARAWVEAKVRRQADPNPIPHSAEPKEE